MARSQGREYRYPFARLSATSNFVTSLDCAPVRHAQIGIIDQAVQLRAS